MRLAVDYDRNSNVNVALLKKKGIDYHILKVIYGVNNHKIEPAFKSHAEKCANNEVYFDVYNYTYAKTKEEAEKDMALTINILQSLPASTRKYFKGTIWFDIEDPNVHGKFSSTKNQEIIKAAGKIVTEHGYDFGVYTGMSFFKEHIKSTCGIDDWWIARYYKGCGTKFAITTEPSKSYIPTCVGKNLSAWQYTDALKVSGACSGDGGLLDCSILYKGFDNEFLAQTSSSESKKEETGYYTGRFPSLPSRGYFKPVDKNTQVKLLQKFLNWALDDDLDEDGSYGNLTKASVVKFQKKYSLKTDGLFGKNCLAKAKTVKK